MIETSSIVPIPDLLEYLCVAYFSIYYLISFCYSSSFYCYTRSAIDIPMNPFLYFPFAGKAMVFEFPFYINPYRGLLLFLLDINFTLIYYYLLL